MGGNWIACRSDRRASGYNTRLVPKELTCQLLISAEADANATDQCAFMFELFHCFFVAFFMSFLLTNFPSLPCSDGTTTCLLLRGPTVLSMQLPVHHIAFEPSHGRG